MAGNLVTAGEEALVGVYRALAERDDVGLQAEVVARLVEGYVAVVTHAEELEVYAAEGAYKLVVRGALGLGVGGHAV